MKTLTEKKEELDPAKPWEIMGTIFGYFAVAKDVPQILRTLHLKIIVPNCLELQLLKWNPNVDFWYLLLFTICTLFFLGYLIFKKKRDESTEDPKREETREERLARIYKIWRRHRFLKIIKSFGLILIKNFLMSRMGVSLYGTFLRPPPPLWPVATDYLKSIDRIVFIDGRGVEYQYQSNFEYLSVSEHAADSDKYGVPQKRVPSLTDIKLLMIGSDIFLFWFLAHLIRRCFSSKKPVSGTPP